MAPPLTRSSSAINTLLVGTDPVAVDRIGYDMVIAKRIEEGVQEEEKAGARTFMDMAQEFQLGIADKDRIELIEIDPQA